MKRKRVSPFLRFLRTSFSEPFVFCRESCGRPSRHILFGSGLGLRGRMKHRVKFRKLGLKTSHRLALLRTMADSVIEHERVKTTSAKAKEVSRWVDWCITWGKKGDTPHTRKHLSDLLRTKASVDKVFTELAPRYELRPGGYTRVLKIGWRKGDNANMAVLELVDREGEVRPAKPVDQGTVERNHGNRSPKFSDFLPSRNWRMKW